MTVRFATPATWATLAAGTLASLAPSARAQEPVVASPRSVWRLGLSADAVWYDNARYVGSAGSNTWSTTGRLNVDHNRRIRHGSFGFGAFGGTIYYPEIEGFQQATYGGHLRLSTSTRQTSFSLNQTLTRTNTQQFDYVIDDVPLPTTGVYAATSSLGLAQRLSQDWELGLNGGFTARRYDSSVFVDGQQIGAGVQLAHLIGRSGAAYVAYQFGNSWYADTQSRAHQVLLGGRHRPTRGVSWEIAGGVGYVEPAEKVYPAALASMSAAGRRSSLTLQYRRDFGQAFGYGRQMVSDIATANASWSPAERFNLSAVYALGYRRDTTVEDYTIRSHLLSGGFGWGITKGLSFAGRYSWEHSQTSGFPAIVGSRIMASLSYGVEWR